tara:strand:+ start:441 stop:746 length:306 start_codon:yes stop_codon:yes gene_type:complete
MSEYEIKLREQFNLPLEGNLCAKCLERLEGRNIINNVLELNASAQTHLGTDSTEQDRSHAYYVARHAKTTIAQIDPKLAEVCFPEIDLKGLPAHAYLGEKL